MANKNRVETVTVDGELGRFNYRPGQDNEISTASFSVRGRGRKRRFMTTGTSADELGSAVEEGRLPIGNKIQVTGLPRRLSLGDGRTARYVEPRLVRNQAGEEIYLHKK